MAERLQADDRLDACADVLREARSCASGVVRDAVARHSRHVDLQLPLLGELPLASATGFDTGVYLVVFGGAMLILSMMGTIKPSRTRVAHLGVVEPGDRSTLTGDAG